MYMLFSIYAFHHHTLIIDKVPTLNYNKFIKYMNILFFDSEYKYSSYIIHKKKIIEFSY